MANETIKYFAYGSNMLSARMIERCPTAKVLGAAYVEGYYISFGKKGADGSGKAVIIKSDNILDIVRGVVFEVSKQDMLKLNAIEFKYLRNDGFEVIFNGDKITTATYYMPDNEVELGLLPYDWYRDIIIKGAKEHGLEQDYISQFKNLIVKTDPEQVT